MPIEKIEFDQKTRRQAKHYYEEESWSIKALAEDYGVSVPVMRRELLAAGAKLRPQGGKGGKRV